MGRTDLTQSSIFAVPEAEAPPHGCAWGGAVAPTSFPRRQRETTEEGRWCLRAESTGATGAESSH
jgi:hypothetical protein